MSEAAIVEMSLGFTVEQTEISVHDGWLSGKWDVPQPGNKQADNPGNGDELFNETPRPKVVLYREESRHCLERISDQDNRFISPFQASHFFAFYL